MLLPALGPIERICALSGNIQPFGQILSVALSIFVAGLLEVVSLSMIVPAVAKV